MKFEHRGPVNKKTVTKQQLANSHHFVIFIELNYKTSSSCKCNVVQYFVHNEEFS